MHQIPTFGQFFFREVRKESYGLRELQLGYATPTSLRPACGGSLVEGGAFNLAEGAVYDLHTLNSQVRLMSATRKGTLRRMEVVAQESPDAIGLALGDGAVYLVPSGQVVALHPVLSLRGGTSFALALRVNAPCPVELSVTLHYTTRPVILIG